MRGKFPAKLRAVVCVFITSLLAFLTAHGQEPASPGSDARDRTRAHQRIAQVPITGRRVELRSMNGARLFVGPGVDTRRSVPLIVHFHGVAWLIEHHISRSVDAALITVNRGSGSSAYGRPFEQENAFKDLIDEAGRELALGKGWSSITLTGFSAGYGAIRAILRGDRNFALVDNVLLLDGLHAGYVPEGRPIADGGVVDAADVDSFVKFAGEAVRGKKNFVITHSEIVPGTYASTTECADYLIGKAGLKRTAVSIERPSGMRMLSRVDKKGFHVYGYAGDTAPDHVDHLHAMPEWFGALGLKHKE